MSESLKSILKRRSDGEPPEVGIVKQFILEKFNAPSSVRLTPNQIIISVKNAALAGTLRMHTTDLQKRLKIGPKTRLVIRIGK